MSSQQPLTWLSEPLQGFLNQQLLPGLAELRQNHSHSDLLLPPDVALPALVPLVKTFAAEHQLDKTVPAVTAAAETPEREQQELERRRIASIRDAAGNLLRSFVLERPSSSASANKNAHLDHAEFKGLFDRLDIAVAFEMAGAVEPVAPLSTIEAVLESLPLSGCARLMDYVESRKSELLSGGGTLSPTRGKGPIVLRIGNELRRRLSKPSMPHTILAGRIAALLSSAFELGERSGSNQEGRFNVDNRTIVEDKAEDAKEEEKQDVEAAAEDAEAAPDAETRPGSEDPADEDKPTADDQDVKATEDREDGKAASKRNRKKEVPEKPKTLEERATPDDLFYSLFWHMQRFFANPALLFEGEEPVLPANLLEGLEDPAPKAGGDGLREFRIGIERVFDLFGAVNEHEALLAGASEKELEGYGAQAGAEPMDTEQGEDGEESSFFPKYLTGRRILSSELRDASFRRQVLVQLLILLQYILEYNPRRRAVWANARNQTIKKPYILTEPQVEWCSSAWKTAQALLREIPGVDSYAASTTQTLRREHNWVQWKLDLCPKLQKEPMSEADSQPFAQALQRLPNKAPVYPHQMGTYTLAQLWEDGIPPPKPGKRKRENDEGIEVEVATDGVEVLELPPMAMTFDDYVRKWSRLEEDADARRAEMGLSKGAVRREATVRRAAEHAAMDEQRSTILTIKTKRLGVEADIREHKKQEPAEDAEADKKKEYEARLAELQAQIATLDSQIPSKAAQVNKQTILQTAQKELEESKNAAAKERQDAKLSAIAQQQHSHSWRALRLASRKHLRHMCKIPADDLSLLLRTVQGDFKPDALVSSDLLEDRGADVAAPKAEVNGQASATETPAAPGTPARTEPEPTAPAEPVAEQPTAMDTEATPALAEETAKEVAEAALAPAEEPAAAEPAKAASADAEMADATGEKEQA